MDVPAAARSTPTGRSSMNRSGCRLRWNLRRIISKGSCNSPDRPAGRRYHPRRSRRRKPQEHRRCHCVDGVFRRLVVPARFVAAAVGIIRNADVHATQLHHPHIVIGVDEHRGCRSKTDAVIDLDRHYLDVPVNADNADRIIADRPDRSGRMRAVAVLVERIRIVKEKILPVKVVDKSVTVVIDTVVRHLARVRPHIRGKVLVRVFGAGIDICDDNGRAAGRQVPRLRGGDLRQSVLGPVARVVRRVQQVIIKIRLYGFDLFRAPIACQNRLDFEPAGPLFAASRDRRAFRAFRRGSCHLPGAGGIRNRVFEFHKNLVGDRTFRALLAEPDHAKSRTVIESGMSRKRS